MSTLTVKSFAACTNADVANAVLSLAAPLCAACGDDDAMKRLLVSLAVTGWNLSLFESREDDGYKAQVAERLPAHLPGEKKEVFTQFVLGLISSKQETYPAMMKGIKSWDLRTDNGELSLTVEALPVKPV
ncbi:hypothetical protein [Desulfoluna spongiiphila]|uniref:hypothetical protein n=1 Tax=Desulfoluna spongiiphila TaxID=419481 RepID=UPI001258146D|nr:hypothetical protein [Desulfoluna spongiiphila]VVS94355.1 hypothetical protein DBB_39270 [Desulfoluna spongiiphila]